VSYVPPLRSPGWISLLLRRSRIFRTCRLLPSMPVSNSTFPAPAAVMARPGDDLADQHVALCRVDLVHHPVLAAAVAGDDGKALNGSSRASRPVGSGASP